jgi:phospholipid/cholesterol/gamma-HCH transport system substrate-binding protein
MHRTRDFVVGLFVLAGIAAIAYLSISVGGFSWRGPTGLKLFASFDETGELALRAPVVIAGVRVGEVSAISLGNDFRARVEMNLNPTLKLPTDTSASIVTAGVLGDRYIELQPGADETILKSGDQISFTESAVILERLIGKLIYGTTKGGGAGSASGGTATTQAGSPTLSAPGEDRK